MRKYIFLPALLAALSAAFLMTGHIWVNSAREKTEIREEILLGDPAAAGLTACYNASSLNRHLSWDSTFTPGHAEGAETDFRFRALEKERPFTMQPHAQICSSLSPYYSRTMTGMPNYDNVETGLRLPVDEVASRTPAGGELTETVKVADYYEYYPLDFSVSRDGYWSAYVSSEEGMEAMERYFRLKADERETAEITVSKLKNGEVLTWKVSIPQSYANLSTRSLITERGIYLIVKSINEEGKPDGRLRYAEGPGIHFIPAREGRFEPADEWFDMTKIHLFYPAGVEELLSFQINPDETRLLVYTCENGILMLTVVDAVSGETLQRLELVEMDEEESMELIEQDTLHLAVVGNGKFCLTMERDGTFSNALCGLVDNQVEYAEQFTVDLNRTDSLAWDGKQLAFAVSNTHLAAIDPPYIGVIDSGGLSCLVRYKHNLSRDPSQRTDLFMEPYRSDRPALTVAFAES